MAHPMQLFSVLGGFSVDWTFGSSHTAFLRGSLHSICIPSNIFQGMLEMVTFLHINQVEPRESVLVSHEVST